MISTYLHYFTVIYRYNKHLSTITIVEWRSRTRIENVNDGFVPKKYLKNTHITKTVKKKKSRKTRLFPLETPAERKWFQYSVLSPSSSGNRCIYHGTSLCSLYVIYIYIYRVRVILRRGASSFFTAKHV